jgi:hypothetical protein
VLIFVCGLLALAVARAQSPNVPLHPTDGRDVEALKVAAAKLREAGALVPEATLTNQLARTNCVLTLPGVR